MRGKTGLGYNGSLGYILKYYSLFHYNYIVGLTALKLAFFMGYGEKSGAMVFILSLDKVSLKKLVPTMNI